MKTTDNELLSRYHKDGEIDAFEELMQRHSAMVLAVSRNVLSHTQDVEDAFQGVFLLLSLKAEKLLKHNSIGGWIHETAVRICLNLRRKKYRSKGVSMEHEPVSKAKEPWEAIAETHDIEALHKEIAKLPKRYREVVVLCYLQNRSRREAAEILDVTATTVKGLLVRGRALLRRRLLSRGIVASTVVLAASTMTKEVIGSSMASSVGGPIALDVLTSATLQSVVDSQEIGIAGNAVNEVVNAIVQSEMSLFPVGAFQGAVAAMVSAAVVCLVLGFSSTGLFAGTDDPQPVSTELVIEGGETPGEAAMTGVRFDTDSDQDNAPKAKPRSHKSAKKATETWAQYVDRMVELDIMKARDKRKWEAGEAVTIKTIRTEQVFRARESKTMGFAYNLSPKPNPQMAMTISNLKQIQQTWERMFPATDSVPCKMTIPGKGKSPDKAETIGLVDKDGRSLVGDGEPPWHLRPVIPKVQKEMLKAQKSTKETWDEYVQRLVKAKLVSETQLADWNSGKELKVDGEFQIYSVGKQEISRIGEKTSIRKNFENGNVVNVPYTEPAVVTDTIPTSFVAVTGVCLTIPRKNSVADDLSHIGFVDQHGIAVTQIPIPENFDRCKIVSDLTAKTPNETWEAYVKRLHLRGYVNDQQLMDWQRGKAVEVKESMYVYYRYLSMEFIPPSFAWKCGNVTGKIQLPERGSRPDTETNSGFSFEAPEDYAD